MSPTRPQPDAAHAALATTAAIMAIVWVVAAGVLFFLGFFVPALSWQRILAEAVLIGVASSVLIYAFVVRPRLVAPAVPVGVPPAPVASAALATIDPVTRSLNQRGLSGSLLEAMAQASRYHTPLAIALLRVPSVPQITAQHGVSARDQALQAIASIIGEALRLPDRVGRTSEDDFLVIMPQTKIAAATKVVERIAAALTAAPIPVAEAQVKLDVAYGVAAFTKGEDLEQLLARADTALRAHGRVAI